MPPQTSRTSSGRFALGFVLASLLGAVHADAPATSDTGTSAWHDPSTLPAEILPRVSSGLFTDLVRIDSGFVAVGERGQIMLSADGHDWSQAESVPTRATLTAVSAIGAQLWAVGHDGVIVHSADAGHHWELQRSDPLQKADAQTRGARVAAQGAPLLGVLFLDASTGYAVGAYTLFLATHDGGRSWQTIDLKARLDGVAASKAASTEDRDKALVFSKEQLALDDETDPHLNCIVATGDGSLLIAAERGTVYRSTDHGEHWQKGKLPYDGSMFGAIGYEGRHVLVYGLRGHVYESRDLGEQWREVATGTSVSLLGGHALPNDGAILSGTDGVLLLRARGDELFRPLNDPAAGAISAAWPVGDAQDLVIASENGLSRFAP